MEKVKFIDIHTHIIPNVDDGARSFTESLRMLELMIEQGVTDVIATPHINSNATTATWEKQVSQYEILKEKAKELNINLYLGAEVKYRKYLITHYDKHVIENTNYILMEFSWSTYEDIFGILESLQEKGFKPIIAHVERYSYLSLDDYKKLKAKGILLQVNAASFLGSGREHWIENAKLLIKEKLVDFIATDAHNTETRVPNIKKAYQELKGKLSENYLNDIFYNNPSKIIKKVKA